MSKKDQDKKLLDRIDDQLKASLTSRSNSVAAHTGGGAGAYGGSIHNTFPQYTYPPISPPITPGYTYPEIRTTLDQVVEEDSDFIFDTIRVLLEDIATEREFTDELYERWLSAKMLLADLLSEAALAESRLELIGGLLYEWRETAEAVGSGVSDTPVDGELSEELAPPQASEAGQDLA